MFKRKSAKAKPAKAAKVKKAKPARKPKPAKPQKAKKSAAVADGVVLQKPQTDIYTVLLVISFVSVLIGCILLWLELSTYGSYPWWKAN